MTFNLILLGLVAAAHASAADEPAQNQKGSNKVERTVEKAGTTLGKTADNAEKAVKRGAAATEKAIDSAGKKTGAALGRTAEKVEKKVIQGAKATEKAIDSAGKKVGEWFKDKTKSD
jgi:hypothetical protein